MTPEGINLTQFPLNWASARPKLPVNNGASICSNFCTNIVGNLDCVHVEITTGFMLKVMIKSPKVRPGVTKMESDSKMFESDRLSQKYKKDLLVLKVNLDRNLLIWQIGAHFWRFFFQTKLHV